MAIKRKSKTAKKIAEVLGIQPTRLLVEMRMWLEDKPEHSTAQSYLGKHA